jgi:YfiH family protein
MPESPENSADAANPEPSLTRVRVGELTYWTDRAAGDRGVLVAFSERSGGVSGAPFETLNLAGHVGDRPADVDENRDRLLDAIGIAHARERLVTSEQVHGSSIVVVEDRDAGRGARVGEGASAVASTDALLTSVRETPLMMFFADCVPVVLVAPGPAVAVVHAGWRGALASLPGMTARQLARKAGCDPVELSAYIGPHIGACHYPVSCEIMSHFVNTFGTFARAESGGLDLDRAVTCSLIDAGVAQCRIAALGVCTAEATDRFFSYRAESGSTGRHCALVCIL